MQNLQLCIQKNIADKKNKQTAVNETRQVRGQRLGVGNNGVTVMTAHENRFKSGIITTNINLVETYLKCQKRSTWYGRRQPATVEWRETLDHVVFWFSSRAKAVWALQTKRQMEK